MFLQQIKLSLLFLCIAFIYTNNVYYVLFENNFSHSLFGINNKEVGLSKNFINPIENYGSDGMYTTT